MKCNNCGTKLNELEKIKEVQNESQVIGEFLDWLQNEQGFTICELNKKTEMYYPVSRSIQSFLEIYFHIDPVKAEAERRQILEDFRRRNASNKH